MTESALIEKQKKENLFFHKKMVLKVNVKYCTTT